MKTAMMMATFVVAGWIGANAQVTTPQNTGTQGTALPAPQSTINTFPYSTTGAYNTMDVNSVPQNIRSTFDTSYPGLSDVRWESNNDVYRSSFTHNGRSTSVLYDQNGNVRETRTAADFTSFPSAVQNSLNGKTINSAYEIRVGNSTYYSTQIDGQDVYYDEQGKALEIPGTR
jgi:hypothetical protein